jgi:hypothetical protein
MEAGFRRFNVAELKNRQKRSIGLHSAIEQMSNAIVL